MCVSIILVLLFKVLRYKHIANLYMSTEVSQGTIVGPFYFLFAHLCVF